VQRTGAYQHGKEASCSVRLGTDTIVPRMKNTTSHIVLAAYIVATLTAGAALLAGCGAPTRHEVLTFFFTGVPEPGQEDQARQAQLTAAQTAAEVQQQQELAAAAEQAEYVPAEYVHGPFGAGRCPACHGVSRPVGKSGARVENLGAFGAAPSGQPFAVPVRELCVGCHTQQGPSFAEQQDLWRHAPVASGLCTVCHDPHSAPRQYLLRAATSIELCTQCHAMSDLLNTPAHARDPRADCLACHNAHVGKTAALLRSKFDELLIYK